MTLQAPIYNEQADAVAAQEKAFPQRMVPMPSCPASEEGVIGACLLSREAIETVLEQTTRDSFYDPAIQVMFDAIQHLHRSRLAVDSISLTDYLGSKGQLDQVGGHHRVIKLFSESNPSNIRTYLKTVLDRYRLRKARTAVEEVLAAIEVGDSSESVIDLAQRLTWSLAEAIPGQSGLVDSGGMELMRETLEHWDRMATSEGIVGISTGIPKIDLTTSGMQPGQLWIIAARPSVGKSALALVIASHVAIDLQLPAAFWSLEMSAKSLNSRVLAARSQVSQREYGAIVNSQDAAARARCARIAHAAHNIQAATFRMVECAGASLTALITSIRRLHRRYKIEVAIIDYLQLIRESAGGSKSHRSREEEVATASAALKRLSIELKIPIVLLCQLNRESERANREPRLSDLRESGAIEQDADVVLLLSRYQPDQPEANPEILRLDVAKNRDGATGATFIAHHRGTFRMTPHNVDLKTQHI